MVTMFNTTRLISQVNLKGALPTGRFTDQEILDLAFDALSEELVPFILSFKEEYYVKSSSASIVANQASYPIPNRASGSTLREVHYYRSNGEIINLERLNLEDLRYQQSYTQVMPTGFYVMGDDIILYPTPSQSGDSIAMFYFQRPAKLVPVSECGAITAIATNTLTGTFPATWTTANTFDLVNGGGSFSTRGIDLAISSVSTTTIVFSATVPSSLAVGDYVCLAGETCLPPIPAEAHALLSIMTQRDCLESMGAATEHAAAAAKVEQGKASLKVVMANRIQGAPKGVTTSIM